MDTSAGRSGPAQPSRLQRAWRGGAAALSRYADWLAGLTWKRFIALAVLTVIATAMLMQLPPFSLKLTDDQRIVAPPRGPAVSVNDDDYDVTIDARGIRVTKRPPALPASGVASGPPPLPPEPIVAVPLPPGLDPDEVREAVEEAKAEIREELRDRGRPRVRVVEGFSLSDHMMQAALLLIVASILIKVMGSGRKKAEARAAEATEFAEGEALKRQVVEARMAAMQAQVEPHFLFNTLASIDHLIETDSARASQMQKNLIALLRASMPSLRDTSGAPRDLGRELAVVRPYVEILKMRMEERLQATIDVPDGLLSAEFPPMMMQSLVENAIKHGLEPKAEGGELLVKAEIVHGKLAVTVADTGLGFGKAEGTAGTGTGLANIRERLSLLYGAKATLAVTENRPSGTRVTITVPYVTHHQEDTPA